MTDFDDTWERLTLLLSGQRLGVLSTQAGPQPYANLVAFAADKEIRRLYFATTRSTRKFHNLSDVPRVALLVDNRSNEVADFHQAMAVTALGVVEEVAESDREYFYELYLAKHPMLDSFVKSPNCAHLRLAVEKYIIVSRFQNVVELKV